jgi:thiazole synthase
MSLDTNLSVQINGQQRRVSSGLTITAMLKELGLDPLRVAVERNLQIVPRSELSQTSIEDGDQYEIVHFVGGG